MKIIEKEKVEENTYFKVLVENKLVKAEKIKEAVENIEDYFDEKGCFDRDAFLEDLLDKRIYAVKIGIENTCDCKNSLFRKTPCRHITYCLKELEDKDV